MAHYEKVDNQEKLEARMLKLGQETIEVKHIEQALALYSAAFKHALRFKVADTFAAANHILRAIADRKVNAVKPTNDSDDAKDVTMTGTATATLVGGGETSDEEAASQGEKAKGALSANDRIKPCIQKDSNMLEELAGGSVRRGKVQKRVQSNGIIVLETGSPARKKHQAKRLRNSSLSKVTQTAD